MVKADNDRKLQFAIDKLKQKQSQLEERIGTTDICEETDTEGDSQPPQSVLEGNFSHRSASFETSGSLAHSDPLDDDETLVSIMKSAKKSSKLNTTHVTNPGTSMNSAKTLSGSFSKSTSSQHTTLGRKRARVILSDDEDEGPGSYKKLPEVIATSDEGEFSLFCKVL